MANGNILLLAADLLEKTADYHDAVETTRRQQEEETKKKVASDLATQISDLMGERIDEETVSKLAESSPEVQGLVNKLARLSPDTVDSLGDVHESKKQAASEEDIPSEDRAFFEAICDD